MSDNTPRYGAHRDPSDPVPEPSTVGTPYTPGQPAAASSSYDPYGYTAQNGGYGQPSPSNGSATPQKLPGRALPILLIVLGAIIALICAPIAGLVMGATSAIDIDSLQRAAKTGEASPNPAEVDLSANSAVAIMLTDQSEKTAQCELVGPDGARVDPNSTQEQEHVRTISYMVQAEGTYTARCLLTDGTPAKSMVVMPVDIGGMGKSALIWGGGTFVVGLALFVGGIVWLVKRNRRRREILAQMPR
ncbi:hypothetical protein H8R18_07795 [Nanchangia anserum]|uniref:Uncharacterized protein n=1 Tax=Nanchangia anserum TaxID=2692125 RepID=A0A8I0KU83_9ACTO|nr:hypothetical protein [Nanchangia anserum]MBD3689423.1 hypothetical protein [Nanchangia anserum]QOX81628.1 hypothetical protein H8R18_07795 [Nanchangia anserum]